MVGLIQISASIPGAARRGPMPGYGQLKVKSPVRRSGAVRRAPGPRRRRHRARRCRRGRSRGRRGAPRHRRRAPPRRPVGGAGIGLLAGAETAQIRGDEFEAVGEPAHQPFPGQPDSGQTWSSTRGRPAPAGDMQRDHVHRKSFGVGSPSGPSHRAPRRRPGAGGGSTRAQGRDVPETVVAAPGTSSHQRKRAGIDGGGRHRGDSGDRREAEAR